MLKLEHTKYIAQNINNSDLHFLRGEGHESYVVHSIKTVNLILQATQNL